MKDLIIPKEKIHEMVKKVLKEYEVVAPTDNEGVILFKTITNPSEMIMEFSNVKVPVKAVLFPQTETLFTFSREKSADIEAPENHGKTLVMGVRPCDAQSLSMLDNVFAGEYNDPYVTKRENTVIVGLSCLTPGITCFCTSVGGNPFSGEYTDILLTDIGDNYYVEVKSEKGENIVRSMDLFTPAAEKDVKKKNELQEKSLAAIKRHMYTDKIEVLDELFDSPFWKDTAQKCLGCAACTYVCPTCHCFDMQDETTFTKGARIRVWDSCMYPEYTVHASGYNPRPERMNRVRNRVYHKYNYFPKTCSVFACVGCGRCIEVCPVNIDIIDVINKTREVSL
jgi:sulfhydrogenase subunit beta (sulfur reductase)